jgi:hypothetical protein
MRRSDPLRLQKANRQESNRVVGLVQAHLTPWLREAALPYTQSSQFVEGQKPAQVLLADGIKQSGANGI